MEIGSIGKVSLVSPVWTDTARAVAPDASTGVATQIAPRQAVTQSAGTSAAGSDSRRPDPSPSESLDRRVLIDSTTHQVVYQAVDEFTGQVVRQTPDQALLRQRAYFIQVEDAKAASVAAADAAKTDSASVERRV